jgi:hypothetical protein
MWSGLLDNYWRLNYLLLSSTSPTNCYFYYSSTTYDYCLVS